MKHMRIRHCVVLLPVVALRYNHNSMHNKQTTVCMEKAFTIVHRHSVGQCRLVCGCYGSLTCFQCSLCVLFECLKSCYQQQD